VFSVKCLGFRVQRESLGRYLGFGVGAHVADEGVERGDVAHRACEGVHCPVVLRHLACGFGFGGLVFKV